MSSDALPSQSDLLLARRERDLLAAQVKLMEESQIAFFVPHAKQEQFFSAASFRRRYARTGNRFGKALADYEVVMTSNGVKRMHQVQVGDFVFDHDGQMTKVLGVFPQGTKKVYRFHFDDDTTIDCCEDHVWTVKGPQERWHEGTWTQRTTAQIIGHVGLEPKHAAQRYVIPLTAPIQWAHRELPLDPYLLGALLGDGGITGKSISFTSWDTEIVDRVKASLPTGCRLNTNETRSGQFWVTGEHENTGQGRVSTNILPAVLASLGLHGKDSYNKFIPVMYLLASPTQRYAILQGLMDTDGTTDQKGVSAEFTTCSASLAQGFQFLCQSLGMKVTTKMRCTSDQNATPCISYRITIRQPQNELFYLSRKRNLVQANDACEKQRVIYKIEKLVNDANCICIAVDSPLHTFVASNFIVTHNSEMGAAEDVSFALGYRPWYPEEHSLRTLGIPRHATKGLIVTTDWDKSTEIFTSQESGANQGKLFKYIPKHAFVEATRNHSGAFDRVVVRHISGKNSVIHLDTVKSFKQNPLGQESSAWDWAHFDEPCPEAMWKAIARGLVDRGGRAWFTCTPLTEPWLDKKFMPEEEDFSHDSVDNISSADHWMMMGSMYDNPHNSKANIDMFLSELTEEERETRISGIPASYSGLVYKEFQWQTHVRKDPPLGWSDWQTPPANHCIYIANDYHFRKNNANLFIAVPPDGPAYVFAAIWKQLSMDEEVAEINAILRGRPYQPIIMDPLASTPNKVYELTAMDEYRIRGLAVVPATKDPVNGIRAVKALLKARDKRGGPCLIFNASLKQCLFEIARGFIWDGDENKPIKKNDDFMECLYRLVLNGLQYVEPASDGEYQPIPARDLPDNVIDVRWDRDSDEDPKKARIEKRYRANAKFDPDCEYSYEELREMGRA